MSSWCETDVKRLWISHQWGVNEGETAVKYMWKAQISESAPCGYSRIAITCAKHAQRGLERLRSQFRWAYLFLAVTKSRYKKPLQMPLQKTFALSLSQVGSAWNQCEVGVKLMWICCEFCVKEVWMTRETTVNACEIPQQTRCAGGYKKLRFTIIYVTPFLYI